MNFHNTSNLKGSHAFLSPSSPAWVRYDKEKLYTARQVEFAKKSGTIIHELAAQLIENQIRVKESDDALILNSCMIRGIPRQQIDTKRFLSTLVPYVNDAIHYGMKAEQVLFYDEFCYGTTDAYVFDEERKFLRIHDLKTGLTPAEMEQLRIYAALFCLQYDYSPADLTFELRIYQNGTQNVENPTTDTIFPYIDTIVTKCKWLHEYEEADDEL